MSYITNAVLDHGMGSRILKTIFLMGYSDSLKDSNFVYTPLTYEGDGVNFNNNQLKLYSPTIVLNQRNEYLDICQRWEAMLGVKGLKIGNINRDEAEKLVHPKVNVLTFRECFNGEGKLKIRSKFSLPDSTKGDYIDIAIHIRRGDVSTDSWAADRWLDDDYYLNIIKDIKDTLNCKYKITVYTQRNNFDSQAYSEYDIIYDDESLDDEIWVKLVNSDILVMGLSSYSYSAALLSLNTCVYTPRHLRLCGPNMCDNWVNPNELIEVLKNINKTLK